jgi:hypothetical protein
MYVDYTFFEKNNHIVSKKEEYFQFRGFGIVILYKKML